MNVLIAGSRHFPEDKLIWVADLVSSLPDDSTVVSGGAVGVDRAAENCAHMLGLKTIILKPNWTHKGAGMERNSDLVKLADVCYVFWDGKSSGSWDTLIKSMKKGIPTYLCGKFEYRWIKKK